MILQCVESGCVQPVCDEDAQADAKIIAEALELRRRVRAGFIAQLTPFGSIHLTKGMDQQLLGSSRQCQAAVDALRETSWEHHEEWNQPDLAELAMAG